MSQQTVYTVENNLMRYGSVRKPLYRKLGRAQKLSKADETALFEYLMAEGWRQQDEMVYWLWDERGPGALVSRSTVSRVLKRNKWTRKEIRRISMIEAIPSVEPILMTYVGLLQRT